MDELKPSPKLKIQELPAIQEHWSKIMEVIRDQPTGSPTGVDTDSDADDALLVDEEPEPEPTTFKQKWEDGDTWWNTFIQSETAFWSDHPENVTEGPYPPTEKSTYVQLPHILLPHTLPNDREALGESVLSAFDTLRSNLPSGLDLAITDKFAEAIEASSALSKEVGQEPTSLYLYSSEGSKPQRATHYNPLTDLQVGDMAVVKVDVQYSSGLRGWDVVRVKAINEGNVECVYLMPRIMGLKYTETSYPDWPDNWMECKMQPITVGKRRAKNVEWADKMSCECVQFSFPAGDKVPAKYLHSVKMACNAISNTCTADALESDADVVE